jgi:hypothetical protein
MGLTVITLQDPAMDFIATTKPLWWAPHAIARISTCVMLTSDSLASFWHISEVEDQNRQMVSRSDRTLARACSASARHFKLSGLAAVWTNSVKLEAGVTGSVTAGAVSRLKRASARRLSMESLV